jgi:hypothetical protein
MSAILHATILHDGFQLQGGFWNATFLLHLSTLHFKLQMWAIFHLDVGQHCFNPALTFIVRHLNSIMRAEGNQFCEQCPSNNYASLRKRVLN